MKNYLKKISTNYGLEYFTDEKNIPNQELVKETIEYFQTGQGSRAFKALEFLNLLQKQYQYITQNYKDSEVVISHLKALPLSNLEKHILFGLLIKWFGGYPFNEGTDFDISWRETKKAIETEFLNYEGETPEKEFCKADNESRKFMMKLGKVFTASLNTGIDVNNFLNSMPGTKQEAINYYNFDELFKDAARNEAFGEIKDQEDYEMKKCRYDFEFTVWLKEKKGLEYGNNTQYQSLLTKEIFIVFLKYQREQEMQQKSESQKQRESWKIGPSQQIENDLQYSLLDLFDEQTENTSKFKSLKRHIENNGFIIFNKETDAVNVYTPELAFIFTSKELPVTEMFKSKEIKINGLDYVKTFTEAYRKGESYFDTEFGISKDTLFGINAESYVKGLHENYIHIKHPEINDGWRWAKRTFPLTLSHKDIRKYGYYSGIVSKVDRLVKTYPKLFEAYDKCDHDQTLKAEDATHREIILAYNFKVEAGLEQPRTAGDWKKERGYKAYQQYYTVSYGTKNKPATEKELKKVIELLNDFPTAQKVAINKLAEIQNL